MLQLGLGLGLGTGNRYFISFFFFFLVLVTNTFVLLFWADDALKYVLIYITHEFNYLRYTLHLLSTLHSNAKISCSTLFHSTFVLNSVPFQQYFMVSHDFMVSDSLDLPAPEVSHAFLLTFGIVWAFTGNSYSTSPTM